MTILVWSLNDSPFAVSTGANSLLDDTVKDGQRRGSAGGFEPLKYNNVTQ